MERRGVHWRILTALLAAALLAWGLRVVSADGSVPWVRAVLEVCRFVGGMFLSALKMLIVPLIVTAVVSSITGIGGVRGFGRLGFKTAVAYIGTGLCAILTGLLLVNLIRPGLRDGEPNPVIREAFRAAEAGPGAVGGERLGEVAQRGAGDVFAVLRALFPENIVRAAGDNGALLGLIVFSLLFGAAVTRLPAEQSASLSRGFRAANEAMVIVTGWVMAFAPLGVFGLLVPVVHASGPGLFVDLGKYFGTVLLALGVHMFVVLPCLLRFVFRVGPWAHFRAMRPAVLLAFSTASSAATLPVTMRCVEEGSGVSRRVSGFTLPLGSTINTDGTALYECVAVLFVAQVMGVQLGVVGQCFVVGAALLTCIGMAGIPSASLVAILLILKSSGIPGAEAAVVALLAVDRPLDMARTAVNVFGDSSVTVMVARSEGEELRV